MVPTMQEYSEEYVIERLNEYVSTFPQVKDAADALGVTRAYLWKVRSGKTPPPESILTKLGFKRERTLKYVYRKLEDA